MGEFSAMLLAALEDPVIRQAIVEAALPRRNQGRQPQPPVTTIAAARDLKAARLAAGRRGRG